MRRRSRRIGGRMMAWRGERGEELHARDARVREREKDGVQTQRERV